MTCAWFIKENAVDSVLFECATCAREIRFAKEGFGAPNPVVEGESFRPPDNVLDWMDPCP